MSTHDDAIRHFQQMAALVEALKSPPAELLEHHYHHTTMGSWWMLLRCKGVRIRLAFDGRDGSLSLQLAASRKRPDDWGPEVWRKSHREGTLPMSEIMRGIRKAVGEPAE